MCLAVPGRVLALVDERPLSRTARVSFGGIVKEVSLVCTPEAGVGDYVLMHVGFAITTVDEAEAQKTLDYLAQMNELAELEGSGP